MTTKDLLAQDRALCGWWVSVAHDPRFAIICALVRSEIASGNPTAPVMEGVNKAFEEMSTITDNMPEMHELPGPGLIHIEAREAKPVKPEPQT